MGAESAFCEPPQSISICDLSTFNGMPKLAETLSTTVNILYSFNAQLWHI